jgi:lysophospholipase L1-like esterase
MLSRRTGRWGFVGLLIVAVATIALVVLALDAARTPVVDAVPEVMPSLDPYVDAADVAIIGDSYTSGTRFDSGPAFRWPGLLAAELDFRIHLHTRGGIGYVTSTGSGVNFLERASKIRGNPEVIIVFGSRNDEQGYDAIRAAASETYAVLARNNPESSLLVVGPPWINSNPPASLVEARDATRDAATEAGVRYIDPLTEDWFAAGGFIGGDGVNPNDAGHSRIAEAVRPALADLLGGP